MAVRIAAAIIRHRKETHASRGNEVFLEHTVVVVTDLRGRGPLVEAGVWTGIVDTIVAKHTRVDSVVRRRLVETYERIGIKPVTTRTMPSVNHDHVDVRLGDQRVDERHPSGTGAHNEVVGLDQAHPSSLRQAKAYLSRRVPT